MQSKECEVYFSLPFFLPTISWTISCCIWGAFCSACSECGEGSRWGLSILPEDTRAVSAFTNDTLSVNPLETKRSYHTIVLLFHFIILKGTSIISLSLWEKKRDSTLIKHTDKFIQVLTPLLCLSSYFAICCRPWGWNMYIEGKVLMPNFFVLCTSILWTRMFGFKEKSNMTYKINTLTQISWQFGCM